MCIFRLSLYKRLYDEREPIEVRVTHDMIEIISHPGPDRSVTLQGLKEYKVYSRRYRNRRIREFMKDLHLTEGRNTGFRKIINSLQANGSPLPEFETDEAHDYFVTRLFIREGFYNEGSESLNSFQNEKSLKQVLKPSSYDKLLPLIECLDVNKYISIQDVMNITGKSRTTAWRYLKLLVDADVVEADGETNNLIYRLKDSYIN